jgi:hypothetical protein
MPASIQAGFQTSDTTQASNILEVPETYSPMRVIQFNWSATSKPTYR